MSQKERPGGKNGRAISVSLPNNIIFPVRCFCYFVGLAFIEPLYEIQLL